MPTSHAGRGDPVDPLVDAVQQIGDRWSLLLVDALLPGPRRFGDLLDEIDGLAPNILSRRLGQLTRHGLVLAEPYSRRPLRHTYRLTAAGQELAGVLGLLTQWAASRHAAGPGGSTSAGVTHRTCGTPVEARWYCPTCDKLVEDDDASDLRWL